MRSGVVIIAALAVAVPIAAGTVRSLVIDQADSGKRIVVPPRRPALLRLSNRWLWSSPAVKGSAVRLVRVDYKRDPGFTEWEIRRRRPGTARVTSAGTPNCRSCRL